ncbi:glucosamine-6-phosphate deaminase [Lactococcus garvieae]|uniref:Glucosamine-6-phosphate deaminase n=1 Tax=Lactococcus garvieae (strain Lg2) TaxID=420890 RepID=F9VEG0_LACGL|nr:glucosamine-6-phosphate deaminase [Lactococcus garvieae]EOT33184.1 glucosamine-6-phosphate deaminase [Lactococcus garvieae ATCC 49156]EOT93223.1 glucosamine-6-phosphate deaminase [Lactococcus garvieae ATCC 49156]QSQ99653.1 glucosamine-6-phosphate deaminase [Lactococcus garvieae]BAK58743.1 glucosamine-6-P isomerase [Lactococcus garvieae ATCC 49156]BAK60711.1 glucosamine-6-P isomerase [Lactococcus garvieae Lg2]
MKVITVKNQLEGAKIGFDLLKEAMDNGAKTLGLATGSTPVEFYNQIVKSDLDFSDMTSVNLDEYVGLDGSDEQSYRYFMSKHLFNEKPFKENFLPNGKAADLEAETKAYDQIIAEHPIDFQILGIGQNGHIGFNEPGTSFEETTHVVDLQESTIKANARFFENEEDVPRQAISMGIASIMAAKSIVLMAYGESKVEAIKGMVEGEITEDMPASILQKHADVVVIADEAAAALLSK